MPVVPDYRIYDLHDRVQERSGGSFDGVVSEKAHGFAEVWSVLFRRILCAVRLYGGVQLEYHVAGLHRAAAADPARSGAAGARKERAFLLPDAGTFNLVQLLYINYDMPFHDDLLCGAPVSGETVRVERLSAQLFPVWHVFTFGGRAGGGGASAGDCGASEYGIGGF